MTFFFCDIRTYSRRKCPLKLAYRIFVGETCDVRFGSKADIPGCSAPAERAVITVLGLGAETLRANLALPIAIGILVNLSPHREAARNALSGMMTLIARYHASFFGNRAAE
jgi:hypothetical protein